jgi:tRNA A37 methylthiotransferase MiaB
VKEDRRDKLRDLESETSRDYQGSLLSRRLDVLVEGADPERPGHVRGTSCRYVPVSFRGHSPQLLRQVVAVRAVRMESAVLIGEPELPAQRLTLALV